MEASGDRSILNLQPRVPDISDWGWLLSPVYVVGVVWVMHRLGVGPFSATNYVVWASSDPELGYGFAFVSVMVQCLVVAGALYFARRRGPLGRSIGLMIAGLLPMACTASLHEPHADFPGYQATATERRVWAERTFGVWYATSSFAVKEALEVRQLVGQPVRLDIAEGSNLARPWWEYRSGTLQRVGAKGEFTFSVSGPHGVAIAKVHFEHRTPERFPTPPRWGQRLPGSFKLSGELVPSGTHPVPISERTLWLDAVSIGK